MPVAVANQLHLDLSSVLRLIKHRRSAGLYEWSRWDPQRIGGSYNCANCITAVPACNLPVWSSTSFYARSQYHNQLWQLTKFSIFTGLFLSYTNVLIKLPVNSAGICTSTQETQSSWLSETRFISIGHQKFTTDKLSPLALESGRIYVECTPLNILKCRCPF